MAWPSRDSIKLWRDACEAAGIEVSVLERVTMDLDKYYVRVSARDTPIRLTMIAELTLDGSTDVSSVGDKMALVTRNTYRPTHIRPLGVQKDHVLIVAQVASVCEMFRLHGGQALTVRELADIVERKMR
jgi:hypothetical protein